MHYGVLTSSPGLYPLGVSSIPWPPDVTPRYVSETPLEVSWEQTLFWLQAIALEEAGHMLQNLYTHQFHCPLLSSNRWQKQLKKGKFILAHNLKKEALWPESVGCRCMRQLVTWHSQSGSREWWRLVLSSLSPFTQLGTSAPGKVLYTFRMGLPNSANQLSLEKPSQTCPELYLLGDSRVCQADHYINPYTTIHLQLIISKSKAKRWNTMTYTHTKREDKELQ